MILIGIADALSRNLFFREVSEKEVIMESISGGVSEKPVILEVSQKPVIMESIPRGITWLIALTRANKPVYEGTVPYSVKMRRRAKNRVARKSRRANRP